MPAVRWGWPKLSPSQIDKWGETFRFSLGSLAV
jgi:hypothetical protein